MNWVIGSTQRGRESFSQVPGSPFWPSHRKFLWEAQSNSAHTTFRRDEPNRKINILETHWRAPLNLGKYPHAYSHFMLVQIITTLELGLSARHRREETPGIQKLGILLPALQESTL